MTEGLGIRMIITLLTALQAGIAALLGFGELIPQEWKIVLVVASAMLAVVLNQVPSWQNAPRAEKTLRARGAD